MKKLLAVGAAVVGVLAVSSPAHAGAGSTMRWVWSPSGARVHVSAPALRVYDNTCYAYDTLPAWGAVRSNIIMENAVSAAAGQSVASRLRYELVLPTQAKFEALVRAHAGNPGPIVLDIESLYFRGTRADAERHYYKLSTLLTWAHHAAPGRVIGIYNQLGHSQGAYNYLERALATQEDAFFPALYTHSTDRAAWLATLNGFVWRAHAIDMRKPVYPYVWPEFYPGTPLAGQYVPSAQWSWQLYEINAVFPGVVIYSGFRYPESGSTGWLPATRAYLPH